MDGTCRSKVTSVIESGKATLTAIAVVAALGTVNETTTGLMWGSQPKYVSEREHLRSEAKVQKRTLPDLWPQSELLRGGEQGLFGCGYILSAQLGFRLALGDLINGSISRELDTCQEGALAVLMEHQRVRA